MCFMALLPDQKFSTFVDGGDLEVGDIVVGLRAGLNTRFDYTGELPPGVIVPVTQGGTGLAAIPAYRLVAGGTTSISPLQSVVAGTSGQLLQSNGAAALPTWTTATFPSGSGTLNHLLRSDGTNWVETTATTLDASDVLSGLTQLNVDNLRLDGNTISSTDTNGDICLIPDGNGDILAFTSVQYNSIYTKSFQSSKPIASARFDVGSGTNTAAFMGFSSRGGTPGVHGALLLNDPVGSYRVYGDDGTDFMEAGVAQFIVDGAVSAGIIPSRYTIYTYNDLGVRVLGLTLTKDQILNLTNPLRTGSGGLGITTTPTNGQIPIGNGLNYVAANLTPGTGISITNGAGSIILNATGGGLSWNNVAGTTQALAVNNGYVSGNAAQTTFTLPPTAAVGDRGAVEGLGAGGWILKANTGQTIKIGSSTTSSAGTLTSAASSDNVYVVCIVANTTWRVQTTNSAGLTVA